MRVQILRQGAKLSPPRYKGGVGYDLHAWLDGEIVLQPSSRILVCTGVAIGLPDGHEGQIRPRSSLSQMGLVAELGTIDARYVGELKVVLHNRSSDAHEVCPGMRIAQLVVSPVKTPELEYVEELGGTERGGGGFGSSGRF